MFKDIKDGITFLLSKGLEISIRILPQETTELIIRYHGPSHRQHHEFTFTEFSLMKCLDKAACRYEELLPSTISAKTMKILRGQEMNRRKSVAEKKSHRFFPAHGVPSFPSAIPAITRAQGNSEK